MIGMRVAAVQRGPGAAVAWIGSAFALGAACAFLAPAAFPAALLPLAIGGALLFRDQRRFLARFKESAFEIARPAQQIPYASLLEVHPLAPLGKQRPRAFAIQVVHQRGSLVIPADLSVASERVYAFLRGLLPQRPAHELPRTLASYREEQEKSFGPERVSSYGGRRVAPREPGSTRRVVTAALAAAGVLWLAAAFRPGAAAWAAAGTLALLFAGLLLAVDAAQRSQAKAGAAGETGLVIGPLGLALQQGALNGHLTWREIKKVTARATATGVGATQGENAPGIALEVEGAQIVIVDAFDRPLSEVHEQILRLWRRG